MPASLGYALYTTSVDAAIKGVLRVHGTDRGTRASDRPKQERRGQISVRGKNTAPPPYSPCHLLDRGWMVVVTKTQRDYREGAPNTKGEQGPLRYVFMEYAHEH